ncbi:CDK-activating kinase assembly factor [Tothia fuscella]|uniref:RNA polymerase II transcription factor B subunit 3 n=1 Tax=Tothia fuscella TaxID=1048955 RepID=A0A9P4TSM9_9PEZI|nr:CDK-activating kinase assembly factor [Tothia fuscella]
MQRNGAVPAPFEDAEEECPICHSKRYLRKDMKFMINPECYHKMCESCVDRIFSHGPAACPVAGCNKTLRRARFRKPTFRDLQMEREVDIRRRVAEVFNREEVDFDTLKDYNDYLNDVEDVTFNLIQNIDVEEAEAKLDAYAAANKQLIQSNMKRAKEGVDTFRARQEAAKESAQQRRKAALQEEEETRREEEEERRNLLKALDAGGDAEVLTRQSQEAMRYRAQIRKEALANEISANENANGSAQFTIRGLKKHVEKEEEEEEKPYDPFDGLSDKREYFVLQEDYGWENYDRLNKPEYSAGGYNIHEYYNRALCEAFSGLGVFIGDSSDEAPPAVASAGAALAAASPMSDDVF